MKHLFLICMDNGGSRMIHRCFANCKNSVTLRSGGVPVQGQSLFHNFGPDDHQIKAPIWSEEAKYYDILSYDWPNIRAQWNKHWALNISDQEKPVHIENCPIDIMRVNQLYDNFENSQFIFVYRNPFAQIESKQRTTKLDWEGLTNHWIRMHKMQISYSTIYKSLMYSYANLISGIDMERFTNVHPELDDLSFDGYSDTRHLNRNNQKIVNLNEENIKRLPKDAKVIIAAILSEQGYSDEQITLWRDEKAVSV